MWVSSFHPSGREENVTWLKKNGPLHFNSDIISLAMRCLLTTNAIGVRWKKPGRSVVGGVFSIRRKLPSRQLARSLSPSI